MKRRIATRVAFAAILASGGALGVACGFPSITYFDPDGGADATFDAAPEAELEADAKEEPPPPDFPDAAPDAFNVCDKDHDTYAAIECNGKDCNDLDPTVNPGIVNPRFDTPDGFPNGDWNCINGVEPVYPVVSCGLLCTGEGLAKETPCGKTGQWVKCNGLTGLLCATVDAGSRVQGCL